MKPAYELIVGDSLGVSNNPDDRAIVLDVRVNEVGALIVVEVEDPIPGGRSFWTFGYGELVDA